MSDDVYKFWSAPGEFVVGEVVEIQGVEWRITVADGYSYEAEATRTARREHELAMRRLRRLVHRERFRNACFGARA